MKIKISRLLELSDLILKNVLHQLGSDWVEIPADYYWDVVGAVRYQYNGGNPPTPVYNALADDCHKLKPVSDGINSWPLEDKVCLLVPLSNLLRAIGDHPNALSKINAPAGAGAKDVCHP
jgi:hypothetical protein